MFGQSCGLETLLLGLMSAFNYFRSFLNIFASIQLLAVVKVSYPQSSCNFSQDFNGKCHQFLHVPKLMLLLCISTSIYKNVANVNLKCPYFNVHCGNIQIYISIILFFLHSDLLRTIIAINLRNQNM